MRYLIKRWKLTNFTKYQGCSCWNIQCKPEVCSPPFIVYGLSIFQLSCRCAYFKKKHSEIIQVQWLSTHIYYNDKRHIAGSISSLSTSWLSWVEVLFGVSQGWNQGIGKVASLLEALEMYSFLNPFGLLAKFSPMYFTTWKSLFSCWLSAGGCC